MKEIIRKWYYKLGFKKEYDGEFEQLLSSAELKPDIKLEDIASSTENCPYNLLYSLYLLEDMKKLYEQKGIPEEIFLDTAYDIVRWTDVWYDMNGKIGLDLMGWISDHLSARLFKLGRLQFDFGKFNKDYPQHGIKKGERCIGVHIPAEGPLTPEACDAAFEQAKEFFAKYYPEYRYRYFTCYSWLIDDTYEKYCGPASNMVKFRNRFTAIDGYEGFDILKYIFRWDARRENIDSFTPTGRFAEEIKEAVLSGEKFHSRLGIIEK